MPSPDFAIKVGDTASSIYATLENSGGTPVDIQGATVAFKMMPISGGTITINAAATNAQNGAGTVDGSTGKVRFDWPAAPTTAGLYLAEWEIVYGAGGTQTFPNEGYSTVLITEEIA